MQINAGVASAAAKKIGCTVAEWEARRATGEKWCSGCRKWLHRDAFTCDWSHLDGLRTRCRACSSRDNRRRYDKMKERDAENASL